MILILNAAIKRFVKKAAESDTFQEYFNTLELACANGRKDEYGWVNWTVAANTPNLVYYQSYNGFGMGWQVHVVNEGDPIGGATVSGAPATLIVAVIVMMLAEVF